MAATELPPPAPVLPVVVGCRGSGVDRAVPTGLAVPPPSSLLRDALARLDGRRFDLDAYLDVLYGSGFRSWGVPDELLGEALDVDPPATLPDALRLAYRVLAWHEGAPGYADATPDNVLHAHRIAALLPEARIVHVIADGHDVVAALVDDDREPLSVAEAALHWRHRVRTGRAIGAELGPERYSEVRRPATGSDDLSDAEAARVELLAGDVLDELGYAPRVSSPSLRSRVDARVRRGGLEVVRLVRRIRQRESAGRW
jgi:hypothetical protein